MNFNFGEVLTRAWQIIWKHKVLWVFGILAGCGRGSSNFNWRGNVGGNNGTPNLPPQLQQFFENFSQNMGAFVAVAVAIFCVIWIVAIFLGTIGRIGLIRGTSQVDTGAEHLVFGQLFSESMPYFWRMFGLSLIVAVPILIVVAVFLVAMLVLIIPVSRGDNASAVGLVGLVPLMIGCFCLLIPVTFVLGMIIRQAENAIVLEGMGVLPSISRGWEVFRNNLGVILLTAIILVVVGMIAGFIIAIPIFAIVVPATFSYAAGQGQNSNALVLMGVCFCLYLPVLLLLSGILTSYTEAVWTLTYMRLTKPQASAPVILEANA